MSFVSKLSLKSITNCKYRFFMLCLLITCNFSVYAANEIKTVGSVGADYPTLKDAFVAINNGILTGNVTLRITANTIETTSAILNASGTGTSNYNSVNIYPTTANLSIVGNINAPLIDLYGANNVTIDGRVGAAGLAISLLISNTSNASSGSTSTIRFVNDASNNSIRYCQIKGSETSTSSGIVFFAATNSTNGNDNNTITHNELTCSSDANRPINVIYSQGIAGSDNNNNIISNNSIYNFLSRSITSQAINILENSYAFTISNNSFFETSTFVPTSNVNYSFINISNSFGSNFKILNNYIGGSEALCGGDAWTKTNNKNNAFNGINITVGTDSPTIIDGNTISNISWNNISSGNWIGIEIQSGTVNVGTDLGNRIGESIGTNAIIFTSTNVGANFYPIQITSSNEVSCINNKIGSLNVTNARYIFGINKNSDDGNTIINNNTIGSATTLASIEVTTNPKIETQFFSGINVQGANNILNNNFISNLKSNSTGSGNVRGIEILTGKNNVTNNTITKISSASTHSTPLIGLSLSNNSFDNTISENIISELEDSNTSNSNRSIIGINLNFTGTNLISKNFITDIFVPSATNKTNIYGIKAVNGTATYSDNVVLLGTSVSSTIYGIYDSGSQDCNVYNNTVYISGSPSSGNLNSYAFYSGGNFSTINYLNNIFVNARSNTGAMGKNYAAYFNYNSAGSLTLDYNLYYTNGNGGVLGYFASSPKLNLPIVNGQDANSFNLSPGFLNMGGNEAADYKPVITKFDGKVGTPVSDDFGGAARPIVPTIGAWEFAGSNMWKGSVNTDWGDFNNWTLSKIPAVGDDILFDPNPKNHLIMDTDRTVDTITIDQSNYKILLNGKKLTLNGALNFTNGAQIDASETNSTLIYNGNSQQYIQSNTLTNSTVFNFTLNNSTPVILSGNLNIKGYVSTNGGRLDAYTNMPTLTFGGENAQQISKSIYYFEKIYNLVADNQVGLTINTPLTILNALTINSGKKLSLSAKTRLQVNGTLLNNAGEAGFILNSSLSESATLVHNTNDVRATYRRFIGGDSLAWHFLASPIRNQPLSDEWKPAGNYGDSTGYDLYVWNEPANCWIYNLNTTVVPTWDSVHSSTNFIPGKGYLYALKAYNQTKQFIGYLNNGNISQPLTAIGTGNDTLKGFNLIGNPYPSCIDWKNADGFTRNMLETTDNGGYNIWIWSYTANNYGVYNSADPDNVGTNNSSRYISPTMGFFVKAANAGNFVFKNAARSTADLGNWLRTKANDDNHPSMFFAVSSTESLGSDEVKLNLGYNENEAGAAKMFSPIKTAPSLYLSVNKNQYSTYYLTTTFENPSLELNFKAGKNGKYTLKTDSTKNNVEVLLLEDKLTHQLIDLKTTDSYTFSSKTTDNPARFSIHFSKTEMKDLALDYVKLYASPTEIRIDLRAIGGNFMAKIFDANGIVMNEFLVTGGEQTKKPIQYKGVLFIKLYNNEKSKTFKLLN